MILPFPKGQSPLASLQRLYERCRPELCAVAQAMGADPYTAEDAVQEAWLRLTRPETLETLDTRDPERLRHLMLLAVRNAVRNLHRRAAPTNPATKRCRRCRTRPPARRRPPSTKTPPPGCGRRWMRWANRTAASCCCNTPTGAAGGRSPRCWT